MKTNTKDTVSQTWKLVRRYGFHLPYIVYRLNRIIKHAPVKFLPNSQKIPSHHSGGITRHVRDYIYFIVTQNQHFTSMTSNRIMQNIGLEIFSPAAKDLQTGTWLSSFLLSTIEGSLSLSQTQILKFGHSSDLGVFSLSFRSLKIVNKQ